jgi:hypothetical protein
MGTPGRGASGDHIEHVSAMPDKRRRTPCISMVGATVLPKPVTTPVSRGVTQRLSMRDPNRIKPSLSMRTGTSDAMRIHCYDANPLVKRCAKHMASRIAMRCPMHTSPDGATHSKYGITVHTGSRLLRGRATARYTRGCVHAPACVAVPDDTRDHVRLAQRFVMRSSIAVAPSQRPRICSGGANG